MKAAAALDQLVQRTHSDREPNDQPIVLEQLAKTYADGTKAVRGISLEVAPGEAYGILGPNGAGKSTTIGMLGTLVRPTAGRAWVAGYDVAAEPLMVRRRIGFAMQHAGLDDFATPTELLVLQARLHDLTRSEAMARAELLLYAMELTDVAEKRIATLSGGTKRRVDLGAALMHLPPVVFLDEPTQGLDPRSRVGVWNLLDHLRRELGITLVLTTHYMDEGDRLCDRVGIIDQGTLVAEGTPGSLKSMVGPDASLEDVYLHHTGEPIARAA